VVENAKQKFSIKNLIKLGLDVAFICIFLIIGASLCFNNINSINNSIYLFFADQLAFMKYLFIRIIFLTMASLLIFIAIVYSVEKRNYMKNLMMSDQELKKEIEDNEGKAEVKGKIHELRQELLADDEFMDKIAKDMGSFVVSNPTHYAILLAYTPNSLPIVLLKGKHERARTIMRISKKVGLPIIENKFVARNLYELTEPGERIPKILIKDIGEIIGRNFLNIQPFIRNEEIFKPKDPKTILFPNLQAQNARAK
jgi:flagellar biosynthesis protein FlhB